MAYDANGFTTFTLAGDAKAVYVADDGNDSNDGLTDSTPKLTIAAGYALLTSGKPDWLLLKRGSTFSEALGHWKKVGRSVSEPMRIATYGSTGLRPILNTGTATGWQRTGGGGSPATIDYIAIQGLYFTPNSYTGTGTPSGISWLGPGTSLLVEDCVFDSYFNGMSIQKDANGRASDVTIRRCIIRDSFGNSGHSQGIFAYGVDGLVIEENVIDRCGVDGTEGPTVFKHNLYIGTENTDVHVRNNVLTRASSHGCQLRCGGELNGNVVIQCPLSLLLGGGDPVAVTHASGITGDVRNNVLLEGTDITGAALRGWGIEVTNVGLFGAMVSDNVIANKTSTNAAGAIILSADSYGSGVGCSNVKVRRNTVYNWRGGISISAAASSPPSPSTFVAQAGHSFRDNDIQSDISADSATLVTAASGADPADFVWDGNNYYRDSGGNEFTDEGTARAYAAWVTAAGETASTNTQTTFPDTAKTLQGYVGGIVGDPAYDFDDAIDRLQEQTSWNWDERLRVQRIAAALRQGWIMATWLQEVCTAIWSEGTRALLVGSPHAAGDYLQNVCNEGWDEATRELTIPQPPTDPIVVFSGATTAMCAATESATSGITRYRVYSGTVSGSLTLTADTSTNPLELYIDGGSVIWEATGLTEGATYYVTFVAVDGDGVESDPTSEISFTQQIVVPVDDDPLFALDGVNVNPAARLVWTNPGNMDGDQAVIAATVALDSGDPISANLCGRIAPYTITGTVVAWRIDVQCQAAEGIGAYENGYWITPELYDSDGTALLTGVGTVVPPDSSGATSIYLSLASGVTNQDVIDAIAAGIDNASPTLPYGISLVGFGDNTGTVTLSVYNASIVAILQGEGGGGPSDPTTGSIMHRSRGRDYRGR